MKFIVSLILMILLSFTACLFLPWWSIAIACFVVAMLIPQHPGRSFLTGFLGLFLLWGALSLWISINNNHILAHKVSMLVLKVDNPYLLMAATGLVGALVAGFASMAGSYCRRVKKQPSRIIKQGN